MAKASILALFGLLWACAPAQADGGFMPPEDYSGADLSEPGQRAVLVHQKGREVLFLFVDYRGDAANFAWIVPTPSLPEPGVADGEVFPEAARYYHHLRRVAWAKALRERGTWEGAGGAGPEEAPAVTVHLTKVEGPYEIAVVSAAEGEGLAGWLRANGFRCPEGMGPVLEAYTRDKWFFTAVRVRAETKSLVALKPLRLAFASADLVYPLRISAASRGCADVRLYVLWGPSGPDARGHDVDRRYGPAFTVGDDVATRCPSLHASCPGLDWKGLRIARIEEQFVPQVMKGLDDRLHVGVEGLGLHPHFCLGLTAGILEALVSERPDEAGWAARELSYYSNLLELEGAWPARRFPREHADSIGSAVKRLGKPLRERLWTAAWTGSRDDAGPVNWGAVALLTQAYDRADVKLTAALEKTADDRLAGNDAINALLDLGSPESRRALARIALQRRPLAIGAVFRFVYSLEGGKIEDGEKPVACRELAAMLADEKLALGDARTRGLGLLRALTGQDFGEDWKAWRAWIAEHLPG